MFDGLEPMKGDGPCPAAFRLRNTDSCTHGPDPAPEGLDVKLDIEPIPVPVLFAPVPKVQCDGDGVSGKRVQVIYAHASDVADRFGDLPELVPTVGGGRRPDLPQQRRPRPAASATSASCTTRAACRASAT